VPSVFSSLLPTLPSPICRHPTTLPVLIYRPLMFVRSLLWRAGFGQSCGDLHWRVGSEAQPKCPIWPTFQPYLLAWFPRSIALYADNANLQRAVDRLDGRQKNRTFKAKTPTQNKPRARSDAASWLVADEVGISTNHKQNSTRYLDSMRHAWKY